MSTLITGGLGFIGSHLAKAIPDARIYDRKDGKAMISIYGEYDTIFHLAASTYLTEGYDKQMIEDNIILTNELFNYHYLDRIVYASSAAIYNPNNLYSYTKRYNEDIAPEGATGLRYYNVYGFGDNGIVSKLIKAAFTGELIKIYGGEQTRDFIHVDDVVRETIKAVDSTEKIIDIGTGVETSINELITMVERISGKAINIIHESPIPIEVKRSRCVYPLSDFTTLRDGLKKTIKQYEDFYRNS